MLWNHNSCENTSLTVASNLHFMTRLSGLIVQNWKKNLACTIIIWHPLTIHYYCIVKVFQFICKLCFSSMQLSQNLDFFLSFIQSQLIAKKWWLQSLFHQISRFLKYLQQTLYPHYRKCTATYTLGKTNRKSVCQDFVYQQFDLVLSSLKIHSDTPGGEIGDEGKWASLNSQTFLRTGSSRDAQDTFLSCKHRNNHV